MKPKNNCIYHRFPPIALAVISAALLSSVAHAATYTQGHGDFGAAYEDGTFDFHFHGEGATIDGTYREDEEFAISDIIVLASEESMITLPIAFSPLGAEVGDTIWVLPEVQNLALPFLGLATEDLSGSEWGNITFTLDSVVSPSGTGDFALWQSGSFGEALVRMSTADPGVDQVVLAPGSHAHYNWGFTEAGNWEIQITVSGTHITDGFVSATQTLSFQVIPEPSAVLLGGFGLLGLAIRRRR
jgi:surface-anchored protein